MFHCFKIIHINRNLLLKEFIEALIAGIIGGLFFAIIHFPLAWILGPLTMVFLWKLVSKREFYWPAHFRNVGQLILGYSMGLSFTADSLQEIVEHFPSMTLITILLVGFGMFLAYVLTRITGMNFPSAVIGTTPGGLSQMVILSEEIKGAEPSIVTTMQTIRMLTVVFFVPTLSIHTLSGGAENPLKGLNSQIHFAHPGTYILVIALVLAVTVIAVRFRFPTPWIIGPLLTAAILTVSGFQTPEVPPFVMLIGQLLLGVYLGVGIKMNGLGNWKKLVPISFMAGLLIVGFSLVLAYGLHHFYSMSMATAFLSIAPGGIAEMGVTAHSVDADVSMVAAYQLFRVFFILFIVPIFLRGLFGQQFEERKAVKT